MYTKFVTRSLYTLSVSLSFLSVCLVCRAFNEADVIKFIGRKEGSKLMVFISSSLKLELAGVFYA